LARLAALNHGASAATDDVATLLTIEGKCRQTTEVTGEMAMAGASVATKDTLIK